MKFLKRLALGCALLLGMVALIAVLGTLVPFPFVFAETEAAPLDRRILVISSAIHTDIAVPMDAQTMERLAFLDDTGLPLDHPDARWLLIGWGGRSFYLETPSLADMKPGPTFRALTLDSSVMHVNVSGDIDANDPAVMPMAISESAYANLLAGIAESFTLADGAARPIEGHAFGTSDRFYEAEGHFNALLGCNIWTSRMLRSAGIRTGFWNPLPFALTISLRLFNGGQLQAALPG